MQCENHFVVDGVACTENSKISHDAGRMQHDIESLLASIAKDSFCSLDSPSWDGLWTSAKFLPQSFTISEQDVRRELKKSAIWYVWGTVGNDNF